MRHNRAYILLTKNITIISRNQHKSEQQDHILAQAKAQEPNTKQTGYHTKQRHKAGLGEQGHSTAQDKVQITQTIKPTRIQNQHNLATQATGDTKLLRIELGSHVSQTNFQIRITSRLTTRATKGIKSTRLWPRFTGTIRYQCTKV
jgi:hypothetical protein